MFNQLINKLADHPSIEGIMLGGSRAVNCHDSTSDYDVYVYIKEDIPEEDRRKIMAPYVSYMEYSNHFFELEDDGILKNGIDIEFIYRKIPELDELLNDIVFNHNVWTGYTTCFLDNLLNANILYDENNNLSNLRIKYDMPYPQELKKAIIKKNALLIKDYMPSLFYQVEKAVKRKDLNSINHRMTELMASYFDILFALNETLHPGEKRLIEKCSTLKLKPINFELRYEEILKMMFHSDQFIIELENLIDDLYNLIADFHSSRDSYGKLK